MGTRQLNFIKLYCDHCGAEGPGSHSADETRAMAYIEGWRFPPRRYKVNGQPSVRSNDVCPACRDKQETEALTSALRVSDEAPDA